LRVGRAADAGGRRVVQAVAGGVRDGRWADGSLGSETQIKE
jgi:hypothetical protein